jgi:hypothetical protein
MVEAADASCKEDYRPGALHTLLQLRFWLRSALSASLGTMHLRYSLLAAADLSPSRGPSLFISRSSPYLRACDLSALPQACKQIPGARARVFCSSLPEIVYMLMLLCVHVHFTMSFTTVRNFLALAYLHLLAFMHFLYTM